MNYTKILIIVLLLFVNKIAIARPLSDLIGICYLFKNDENNKIEPCVIGRGWGAGGHYRVLYWLDGKKDIISLINYCPNQDIDSEGFCEYTINEKKAILYYRNVFKLSTDEKSNESIECYQIVNTSQSICYKIPDEEDYNQNLDDK